MKGVAKPILLIESGSIFLHLSSRRFFVVLHQVPGNPPSFLLETMDSGPKTQLGATRGELTNPQQWRLRPQMKVAWLQSLRRKPSSN